MFSEGWSQYHFVQTSSLIPICTYTKRCVVIGIKSSIVAVVFVWTSALWSAIFVCLTHHSRMVPHQKRKKKKDKNNSAHFSACRRFLCHNLVRSIVMFGEKGKKTQTDEKGGKNRLECTCWKTCCSCWNLYDGKYFCGLWCWIFHIFKIAAAPATTTILPEK